MHTTAKLNSAQSDGSELSFNDVALKAKDASRGVGVMAMVGMAFVLFGKRPAAYRTGVALESEALLHQVVRKASAQQPSIIPTVISQSWIRCKAFIESMFGTQLCCIILSVLATFRASLRSGIDQCASGFHLWSAVVLPLPRVDLRQLFRWQVFTFHSCKNLLSVFGVVLTMVAAVYLPLFRRAVGFFHLANPQHVRGIILSNFLMFEETLL